MFYLQEEVPYVEELVGRIVKDSTGKCNFHASTACIMTAGNVRLLSEELNRLNEE